MFAVLAIVDELYRDSQRLASLRNGRDVMIEAFGWDPDVEGW